MAFSTERLPPCPFEHTEDALRLIGDVAPHATNELDEDGRWCVTCPVCQCSTAFYLKKDSAIYAWSRQKASEEALKGICVYCGEVERYESIEQKAGAEGNQMRIAHIRQCAARPELKLIACVEETIAALKKWVHWYAVDSTEFNRDSAYDTTLALLEKYQRAGSEPRNDAETDADEHPMASHKAMVEKAEVK